MDNVKLFSLERSLNKLSLVGYSVRLDNGFRTNQSIEYCSAKGIFFEFTASASSYQKGAEECANRDCKSVEINWVNCCE
jgi:IS30 family transposase